MAYTALRSFKYQDSAGKMQIARPGQELPEASSWRGLERLIKRGWLTDATGHVENKRGYVSPSMRPEEKKPVAQPEVKELSASDLQKMLKSELIAKATAKGIQVEDLTKSEIIKAILGGLDGGP